MHGLVVHEAVGRRGKYRVQQPVTPGQGPRGDAGLLVTQQYKASAGFRFPYADYFSMTVDNHGTSDLTWSEGNSYNGPGNTW
jgi:hypothetical protein